MFRLYDFPGIWWVSFAERSPSVLAQSRQGIAILRTRERNVSMASDQFVIDGICHPYNFSEENLNGRFGRIFNDILYAFHPLINPPETVLSKDEWQHDWQTDEFMETMFLES